MQISKTALKKQRRALFITLFLSFFLSVWLNQNSIARYFQQIYHRPSPLLFLEDFTWWRLGGQTQEAGEAWRLALRDKVYVVDRNMRLQAEENIALEEVFDEDWQENEEIFSEAFTFPDSEEIFIDEDLLVEAQKVQERQEESLEALEVPVRAPLTIGARDLTKKTPQVYDLNQEGKEKRILEEQNNGMQLVENENKIEEIQEVPIRAPLTIGARDLSQSAPIREKAQDEVRENIQDEEALDVLELAQEQLQVEEQMEETQQQAPLFEEQPIQENANFITLRSGDSVLLIGDSMMQGVAPYVRQALQNHQVQSIDLSKQNTGLSYPDFFDWPKTVEDTLRDYGNIRALVVFLGPNDPWDFPNPEGGRAYLRFQSSEWEAVYGARIQRILDAAAKHNVGVIWLGLPMMKPQKLNEQMNYIDRLLRQEVTGKGIFLPTKYILTGGEPDYVDSIMLDGKRVRVRSKDGIHFTPAGQREMAQAVMRRFRFAP